MKNIDWLWANILMIAFHLVTSNQCAGQTFTAKKGTDIHYQITQYPTTDIDSDYINSATFAIQGGTLIDVEKNREVENSVVIINNGKIHSTGIVDEIEIPKSIKIIDAHGQWIIPGLIEVHTHSDSQKSFIQALASGITTMHSLPGVENTTLDLEIWASVPSNPSPNVIQNSWMFSGSFPDNIAPGVWRVEIPSSLEEAIETVEKIRNKGFQELKVFLDSGSIWFETNNPTPNLTDSTLKAIIERAHQLRMKVYAHTWELEHYQKLLEMGVDNIIHPAADSHLTESDWEKMKTNNMTWTTTISGLERLGAPEKYAHRLLVDPNLKKLMNETTIYRLMEDTSTTSRPFAEIMPRVYTHFEQYKEVISKNTLAALEHEVSVAVGSDNPAGLGTHIEMEILQEMGLSPAQVLKAATWNGAITLGLESKIGSLGPGKRADLLILNSNPIQDIRNTRDISIVIKEGIIFHQDDLIQSF